jgi:hypothetical protein
MSARHRCRNQHCRLKLKAPAENEHHAFCCHGCFDRFYLKRCRVCERDIASNPITGERRKRLSKRHYCGRKCKQEAARFPRVYAWGVPEAGKSPVSSRSAHSTHTFSASRGTDQRLIACAIGGGAIRTSATAHSTTPKASPGRGSSCRMAAGTCAAREPCRASPGTARRSPSMVLRTSP